MHGGGAERRSHQHSRLASTLQPGGWGLLLVDPPRIILPGAPGLISPNDPALGVAAAPSCSFVHLPRMIQSRASARHLSVDDPVRGAAAPAA